MKTDLTTHKPPLNSPQMAKPKGPVNKPQIEDLKKPSPDYQLELSSKLAPPLPRPEIPLPKIEEVVTQKAQSEVKTQAIQKIKPHTKLGGAKKPAIIFVKGLDIFSSPSKSEGGYAGVGRMAESIEGARIYGWNQKQEILDEVLKTHPDFPVVLIGHSLGGDTALEVAEELDSLENKFRTVDLLVTMDAVGAGNDIIPQNVKKHFNVFGEKDLFFNDGPHVARRNERTSVTNILSPLDHTDIDDDKEIQYEVVSLIKQTLSGVS